MQAEGRDDVHVLTTNSLRDVEGKDNVLALHKVASIFGSISLKDALGSRLPIDAIKPLN